MADFSAYTLAMVMTKQAVIQRDVSTDDAYGGQAPPDWQPHLTVPCGFWWDKASGTRSQSKTVVSASREVPVSAGAMIIPSGTDVTEEDRISAILNPDGTLWVDGIFTIISVLNEFTHFEMAVERTALGA